MTAPLSWSETAAGLIGGIRPELPFAEQRREFYSQQHQEAVIAFQEALGKDPAWQWARQRQAELAEQGWPGQVITIGEVIPAPLRALHLAAAARDARQGVTSPGHTDETYAQMTADARAKYEAAQARLAELNAHLPPGSPR